MKKEESELSSLMSENMKMNNNNNNKPIEGLNEDFRFKSFVAKIENQFIYNNYFCICVTSLYVSLLCYGNIDFIKYYKNRVEIVNIL